MSEVAVLTSDLTPMDVLTLDGACNNTASLRMSPNGILTISMTATWLDSAPFTVTAALSSNDSPGLSTYFDIVNANTPVSNTSTLAIAVPSGSVGQADTYVTFPLVQTTLRLRECPPNNSTTLLLQWGVQGTSIAAQRVVNITCPTPKYTLTPLVEFTDGPSLTVVASLSVAVDSAPLLNAYLEILLPMQIDDVNVSMLMPPGPSWTRTATGVLCTLGDIAPGTTLAVAVRGAIGSPLPASPLVVASLQYSRDRTNTLTAASVVPATAKNPLAPVAAPSTAPSSTSVCANIRGPCYVQATNTTWVPADPRVVAAAGQGCGWTARGACLCDVGAPLWHTVPLGRCADL